MTLTKICPICGREFAKPIGVTTYHFRTRRVYCGRACQGRAHALMWAQRRGETDAPEPDDSSLCECGQPATTVIRFRQFSAEGHERTATLRVCEDCRQMFEELERGQR